MQFLNGRLVLCLICFVFICHQVCVGDTISAVKGKLSAADEAASSGASAIEDNNVQQAKRAFRHVLELYPEHVGALLGMFKVSMQEGSSAAAKDYIRKALEIAPNDAEVQGDWAHFLFFEKRFPEAVVAYNASLKANPQRIQSLLELGDLNLTALHDVPRATQCYRRALAINPKNIRAHMMLANALSESKQFDAARSELEEAAQLDSSNALVWQHLGDFLYRTGHLKESLAAFDKALALQPNLAPARIVRGEIFLGLSQNEKALADFQNALAVIPHSAALYVDLGIVRQQLHQDLEAEQAYRTALKLDPDSAGANNNLAFLLANKKSQLSEAEFCANKAIALNPKEGTFYDTLGWVYRARGDSQRALRTLTRASALGPANPDILYHMGLVYSDLGQRYKAIDTFRKMLALQSASPDREDAKARLALLTARN